MSRYHRNVRDIVYNNVNNMQYRKMKGFWGIKKLVYIVTIVL